MANVSDIQAQINKKTGINAGRTRAARTSQIRHTHPSDTAF